MMLGLDIGLEKSDHRPRDEDVLAEYDKAINNLTINEENRLKIKVEKLEVEASQLQRLQGAVRLLEMEIIQITNTVLHISAIVNPYCFPSY